jgi:hypothetical protein
MASDKGARTKPISESANFATALFARSIKARNPLRNGNDCGFFFEEFGLQKFFEDLNFALHALAESSQF